MVQVELKGGLGNQLFQYAAARALAAKHGTRVSFDAAHYRTDQLRNIDLLHLNVDATQVGSHESKAQRPEGFIAKLCNRLAPYSRKRFYKQPYFHFDPRFFELPSPIYLRGYFQSERYFLPVQELIRREFTFRQAMPALVQQVARQMREEASVSLHIRRGDYKNPETLRVHGIQPLSYYHQAVALMQQRLGKPRFYLFTDDPKWVAENLQLDDATLVSGPLTRTHFEDLYLMQQCRHNVIANSSFSWWGAWLNDNPEKTVIAPKAWFNEGPKDTEDLLPAAWLRL